jgi:hypothetical protein
LNSVRPKLQDSLSVFVGNMVLDEGVSKFFVHEASNSRHGTKRFFTGIQILVFKDWMCKGITQKFAANFFLRKKTNAKQILH